MLSDDVEDIPLLDNPEFFSGKPEPASNPTPLTFLMYENDTKFQRQRYSDEPKECPFCGRLVTQFYKMDLACTLECSLGMVWRQPRLYDYIHALMTRDNLSASPAPDKLPNESSDVYWKRVMDTLYVDDPIKAEFLKEQLRRNQVVECSEPSKQTRR